MTWREFRIKKSGKLLVWKIRNLGESYETEHGQLNGAMQNFSDTPGAKGKEDTKAYVNAVDNCAFHIQREIRKKEEHGYVEVDGNGNFVTEQITTLSWDKILPKNFCGYKPQTSIEDKALRKLHTSGKARYTRKIDGQCHLAVHHTWGWEIYTRRMDLATARFPKHIEALESTHFDVGTILEGEMVCLRNGKEDFKAVSRICRSLPEEARKLVLDEEVPEPKYMFFDILFYNGLDLKNQCYDYRMENLREFNPMSLVEDVLLVKVDNVIVTPDSWEQTVIENDWEGMVVVDGEAVPGDKFYSFDGEAKRPKGSYKLKPVYEGDTIIYAATTGSGKRLNGIGALFIAQFHPETNKLFSCGKVGSGPTEEDLDELEKLFKEKKLPIFDNEIDAEKIDLSKLDLSILPVCQTEYYERYPKTQKFRHAVYVRLRDDKKPEECIADRLVEEE